MKTDLLHITAAECVSDYTLRLTFSNDGWTVDWNNEIGLAPEYLYEHSQIEG